MFGLRDHGVARPDELTVVSSVVRVSLRDEARARLIPSPLKHAKGDPLAVSPRDLEEVVGRGPFPLATLRVHGTCNEPNLSVDLVESLGVLMAEKLDVDLGLQMVLDRVMVSKPVRRVMVQGVNGLADRWIGDSSQASSVMETA